MCHLLLLLPKRLTSTLRLSLFATCQQLLHVIYMYTTHQSTRFHSMVEVLQPPSRRYGKSGCITHVGRHEMVLNRRFLLPQASLSLPICFLSIHRTYMWKETFGFILEGRFVFINEVSLASVSFVVTLTKTTNYPSNFPICDLPTASTCHIHVCNTPINQVS